MLLLVGLRAAAGDDQRPARGRDRRARDRHLGLDGRQGRQPARRKGRTTRLLAARDAAIQFLDELPDKYRVSLVTFGDRGDRQGRRRPTTTTRSSPRCPPKSLTQGTALASGIDVRRSPSRSARSGSPSRASPRTRSRSCSSPTAATPRQADPQDAVDEGAQDRSFRSPPSRSGRTARWPSSSRRSRAATNVIQVPVAPDALQEIARGTDGTFFQARTGRASSKQVYEDLGSRARAGQEEARDHGRRSPAPRSSS